MRNGSVSLARLTAAAGLLAALAACAGARLAPGAADAGSRLYRICVGERFGYIDESGAVAIPPTYPFAEDFEQDRAAAWAMSRQPVDELERANPQTLARGGLIDRTGRFVVPPVYDHVGPLADGLAVVGLDGRSGYVDRDGRIALPLQFTIAETFSEGLAYVEDDAGRRFIDRRGGTVVDMSRVKWAANGRETVVRGAGPFSEGLAVIRTTTPGEDGAEGWGFMDAAGRIVVEPRFRQAWGMRDGLAHVSLRSEGGLPGGDAIIDRGGRYVIPPGRGWLGVPGEGRVRFSAGVGGASRYGFLDLRNEVVVPPRFDHACLVYSEGLCAVRRGDVWAFIDEAGSEVITLPADTAYADEFHSGLAKVQTPEGQYYVRRDGTRAFGGWFAHAGRFDGGLALVTFQDRTMGYVDVQGRVVHRASTPCTFPGNDRAAW